MKELCYNWLKEENISFIEISDEKFNFHIIVDFPDKTNKMEILQPNGKSDTMIIGCGTKVSDEHLDKMRKMNDKKKVQYLMEFRYMLNSYPIEFQIDVKNNLMHSYFVSDVIFKDGINKEKLISSLKRIFKVKLQGVYHIQMNFGVSKDEFSYDSSMFA